MEDLYCLTTIALLVDLLIRIGLALRVIMRRRPVGVTFAWLAIVLSLPFVGPLVYLTFGELRLGNRPSVRAAKIHDPYEQWLKDLTDRSHVDWSTTGPECLPLARLAHAVAGIPTTPRSDLELINDTDSVMEAIIADVDRAKRTVHMEFYIWHVGGMADTVAEAVLRAAGRGVTCRMLVDAVGSSAFLRSELAQKLRQGGVAVAAALPGGPLRALFVRFDLRLHRKIVVVDGEVAYTGSMNMVDPRFFKQDAGVGQWIDAMVRVRGPAVEGLNVTFIEDWELETSEGLDKIVKPEEIRVLEPKGTTAVQVVPSGPLVRNEAIQQILLMAIYGARRELVLTSPYFVPDEAMITALTSAARRGVDVTVVVPAKVDSLMVRLASQAHKGDLIEAGVRVALFDGGLLHTKSITVDGEYSLFGSLNLDPRSLHLNFEITLAVYDSDFTRRLRALQETYLEDSEYMELGPWLARSGWQKFVQNGMRLLSPLL